MAELTLAIETSNPSSGGEPGVALGVTGADTCDVLGMEPLGSGERHDDLLMPAVDRLFRRLGREPRELDRIAVSIGPGGYTGLRIASAAANLIGFASGARIVGVPSAWVVARGLAGHGPLAVCLACKGDSAWVTRFDAQGEAVDGGALRTADDLALASNELLIGDRFLPASFREAAERAGRPIIEPVFSAEACLASAWRFEACEPGKVTPLYGREAEAVTRWRELHGGG